MSYHIKLCTVAFLAIIIDLSNYKRASGEDWSTHRGIVRVEVKAATETDGNYSATGTGFILGKGNFVLTARHVVQPPSPILKDSITGEQRWKLRVTLRDSTGLLRETRDAVLAKEKGQPDPKLDVAILIVAGENLPEGFSSCPEPDYDKSISPVVTARGFPAKKEGSQELPSKVESVTGILQESNSPEGIKMFAAETSSGFSGAPVFFENKVIGVLTAGTDGKIRTSNYSSFTPLKVLRGEALDLCDPKCRLPEHGVEKWDGAEDWVVESGWMNERARATEFCDSQRSKRSLSYRDRTIFIKETTERIWELEPLNGSTMYQYRCVFLERWAPEYKAKDNEKCPKDVKNVIKPR